MDRGGPDDGLSAWRAEIQGIEAMVREHPGSTAYHQIEELSRAWATFDGAWINLFALMKAGETDEEFASGLIDWHGVERAATLRASDSALNAFESSLSSLIDITRHTVAKQPHHLRVEYESRNAAVRAVDGAGFLRDLRNHLMHVGHAPWVVTASITANRTTARILMSSDALLRWSGWKSAGRTYIEARENVDLSESLPVYRTAMQDLYRWLLEAIWAAHAQEIEAANDLIRQRNLVLTGGLYDTEESFMAMVQRAASDRDAERSDD